MNKIEEMKAQLMALSLPIGLIIVTAYPEYEIIFANSKFHEMLGYTDDDEVEALSWKNAWDFICVEDIDWIKELAMKRIKVSDSYQVTYRIIKKDGSFIWVNQYSQHMSNENGEECIFAYYTDITVQKRMEETIRAGAKRYETLIHSIPGGVGMYRWDANFTPIFISDGVYNLCGMTKEEYTKATCHSTLDVFHPDDRQGLMQAVSEANINKHKFDYTHRVLQKDGSYRWMHVSGQLLESSDKVPILYTVFTDVHDQFKAEEALRESEFRYAAAVRSANINIWEYDYKMDTMTIFSTSPQINPENFVIPNYLHSVVEEEHLRKDSAPVFFDMIRRLKEGEKEVTADLWIREQKDAKFWCERVIYTNIFDANGNPQKAYCVGRDVTKEKEAEKRYQEEVSYREAMQKATLASFNVNLTQNTILDYKSKFPEILEHMKASKTVQDYFDHVYTEIITEKMKKKYLTVFGRDVLLRYFSSGETTLSMELIRKINGRRYWTIVTAHMMKRTEDNDIVAFLYSTDITNERMMQNVMKAIVKTDYDFLVVVDGQRNTAVRYSEQNLGNDYAIESENFEEETHFYIHKYVCSEDVSHVVEELTISNILKQLKDHGTYHIYYSVPNSQGKILQKQLRFSYINSELKSFLMTRSDITDAVEEQKKKNKELVEAVEMAERANAAKSEFLSRISHEIRTPMNAIIGMSQIAMQSLDDRESARDSIEKSLYASQYLLLLLNDILDMSRIESGKIILKNEPIICDQLLDAIGTIINAQANEKGVTYMVTKFEGCKKSYLGDRVRLQQILINILSNAVKFTPQDGVVHLDISQVGEEDNKAIICFKISDTGIGISETFLPKIFEPFSQENISAKSNYGGSGLGLAISKNLAQLMGGTIFVESSYGKGTIFQVIIPFGSPKETVEKDSVIGTLKYQIDYDFSGKNILLVEDHQLNIMVAKKLLEFKKASVDVAENGAEGLAKFMAAPEHGYDLILMDIRMPVMDGLEAARSIRNLDKEWAKKIPIIAMSANAFDEDIMKSKSAGMNTHLAKPIEPELLYRTIYQFLQ
ncbi:MAG: PAS domain S-box protein [Lachnospiraceae bacterium]